MENKDAALTPEEFTSLSTAAGEGRSKEGQGFIVVLSGGTKLFSWQEPTKGELASFGAKCYPAKEF